MSCDRCEMPRHCEIVGCLYRPPAKLANLAIDKQPKVCSNRRAGGNVRPESNAPRLPKVALVKEASGLKRRGLLHFWSRNAQANPRSGGRARGVDAR